MFVSYLRSPASQISIYIYKLLISNLVHSGYAEDLVFLNCDLGGEGLDLQHTLFARDCRESPNKHQSDEHRFWISALDECVVNMSDGAMSVANILHSRVYDTIELATIQDIRH